MSLGFSFCFISQPNHCLISVAVQHMQYVIIPVLLPHLCVVIFSWIIPPGEIFSSNYIKKQFFLSTYG